MATRKISDKVLDDCLKAMVKKFGDGYAVKGLAESNPKSIPTGYDDLDSALTGGSPGLFLGGIIEVCGGEGSGKSAMALRTVGNAQKLGHKCCWIDAEAAFDPSFAKLHGCDPTQLVIPDLSETKATDTHDGSAGFLNSGEILEMMYKSICANVFGLVVLDSVAGLIPDRLLQDEFDGNKAGVSEVARNMSDQLKKIAQACKKTETSAIFINQLRDQPGAYFQNKFHTPGGRALRFFAHQRLGLEKIGGADGKVYQEEDGQTKVIGHYARVTIIKNRKAPPLPEGTLIEIPIYYKEYFPDTAKKCYDIARDLQVVTMRNGELTWKDEDAIILKVAGESGFLAKIRTDKMEARLAAACVTAEASEKNKSKKNPTKVPHSIVELAASFKPSIKSVSKGKKLDLSD